MNRKMLLVLSLFIICFKALSVSSEDYNNPDVNKNLLEASKNGDLQAVSKFIRLGADVNTRGKFDFTPIITTVAEKCNYNDKNCSKNKIAIIDLLLENGADINSLVDNKLSALVYAIDRYELDVIEFLIKKGISKDLPGMTINAIAIEAARDTNRFERQLELLSFLSNKGINLEETWNGYTPLLNALYINRSNTDFATELLKLGVNTKAADSYGQTALMWAAGNTDPKALKYIISVSLPEEINRRSDKQETALHWACRNGLPEHASLLIEAGADVNVQDVSGNTPLHMSTDIRYKYSLERRIATARVLLDNRADVNIVNNMKESALQLVSEYGFPEYISVLLEYDANPSVCNSKGESAIFRLASRGHAKAIELLCEHKADVNMPEGRGSSPLIEAIQRNNPEAALALLNCQAEINYKSRTGETALYNAAGAENAFPVLQRLIELGADVNLKGPNGITPLMNSIFRENCRAIIELLDKGADIHLADGAGNTALHYTAKWDTACNVTQKLIDMGADLNLKNKSGETPLMISNYIDVSKQLITGGADPSLTDLKGRTALDLARLFRRKDIIEYLEGI